jgi:branched-chain amino acid transport system substrate-binding protein
MELFNPGAANVTGQLGRIARSNPEALMVHALPTEAPTIVRARMQTALRDLPLFVNAGQGSPTFIEQSGKAAEGAVSVVNWDPQLAEGPLAKKFVRDYEERFGNVPNQYAAEPYDAVRLIAWAAGEAGLEPSELRDAIRNAGGKFEGVITNYEFDDRGQVLLPEYIMVVENGRWNVTDEVIEPADIDG